MRFGQVEQLLLAFHQSRASDSAGGNSDEGLDDVKPAALWIRIWVEESQNTGAPVRHMENQEIEWQKRSEKTVAEVLQVKASHEEHATSNGGACNCRPQVRLKYDKG